MKKIVSGLAFGLLFSISTNVYADIFTLDFEGIGNENPIGDFYNGGAGTDYGVTFSDNALAVVDEDAGGRGNFGGEPSPDTVMFFLTGDSARMTVDSGFDTGFSFWYSAVNYAGTVEVYDTNDTLLAGDVLPVTPSDGGDPNGPFSPFFQFGVSFDGIASYVFFGGVQNQVVFDNVTFGSATPGGSPVPIPSTVVLFGLGLAGITAFGRGK